MRDEIDPVSLAELPPPYNLFHQLARGSHFHFGAFEHAEEDIRPAQVRMLEHHIEWLDHAERVVDLGCGLGGTSVTLALRGHQVTGVDPVAASIAHARRLAERNECSDRCGFENATAEAWFADRSRATDAQRIDGILFQESFQHIPSAEGAIHAAASLLHAGGVLVIGDQVLRDPSLRGAVRWHEPETILESAEAAGFELRHRQDLTEAARPTIRWSLDRLEAQRETLLTEWGPETAEAIDLCLRDGTAEEELWAAGQAGFELFVFVRR